MYLWDSNILRCHKQGNENLSGHLQRVVIDEIALPSVVVAETLRGKCEYALKAEPVNIQFAHELLREALIVRTTLA
jgi:predicted nucleic acid-binding protein